MSAVLLGSCRPGTDRRIQSARAAVAEAEAQIALAREAEDAGRQNETGEFYLNAREHLRAARDHYLAQIDAGKDRAPETQALVRHRDIVGGELLPYGIEKNRRTLEAIIQDSVDQRIIPEKVRVEELFAPDTLDLE